MHTQTHTHTLARARTHARTHARTPARTPAQRATGATKMNEVSSRSHAVCIIIVEKCTTALSAGSGADASTAAAAAAVAADNIGGLLMAAAGGSGGVGVGPGSRKAVAAAAALSSQLQHSIKVGGRCKDGRLALVLCRAGCAALLHALHVCMACTRPHARCMNMHVLLLPCTQVGKLNLVDLAGSERVHITGATGGLLRRAGHGLVCACVCACVCGGGGGGRAGGGLARHRWHGRCHPHTRTKLTPQPHLWRVTPRHTTRTRHHITPHHTTHACRQTPGGE
jgi:hypothetical protein